MKSKSSTYVITCSLLKQVRMWNLDKFSEFLSRIFLRLTLTKNNITFVYYKRNFKLGRIEKLLSFDNFFLSHSFAIFCTNLQPRNLILVCRLIIFRKSLLFTISSNNLSGSLQSPDKKDFRLERRV